MEAKRGDGPDSNWNQFLNDLKAVVQDGQELLKTGFGRAREATATRMRSADRVIRDRPYHSLAIGFALGIAAGFLLQRSLSSGAEEQED